MTLAQALEARSVANEYFEDAFPYKIPDATTRREDRIIDAQEQAVSNVWAAKLGGWSIFP
jgi:hypothetical protein